MAVLDKRIRTKGMAGTPGGFSANDMRESTRMMIPATARRQLRVSTPFLEVVRGVQHGPGFGMRGFRGRVTDISSSQDEGPDSIAEL
jgi:hypothetical protein